MERKKIIFFGGRDLGVHVLDWLCQCNWAEIVGVYPLPYDFDPNYAPKMEEIIKKNNLAIVALEDLKNIDFDIGLSVNFHKILKKDVLNLAKDGFYNVHHSYNLRLRGRNITTQAILNIKKTGFNYHGTTLHKIVPALDCGPIVASYACDISKDDTAYTLFKKVDSLAFDMIKTWLPRVARKSVILYETPSEGYFNFKNKDLPSKCIDIDNLQDDEIYDNVRAFDFPGYDPAYIERKGVIIPLVIKERDNYIHPIEIGSNVFYTK